MHKQQRQLTNWTKQQVNSRPAVFFYDKPQSGVRSSKVAKEDVFISETLHRILSDFCDSEKSTFPAVLLSALRATHFRHTGTEDANIGLLVLDGSQAYSEENVQCIRSTVQGSSFKALVEQIKSTTKDAVKNQRVPYERFMAEETPPNNQRRGDRLVQLVFIFHTLADTDHSNLKDRVAHISNSGFDIAFHFWQGEDGFQGSVHYAKDLFYCETIKSIISIFCEILQQGINQPDVPITSFPLSGCLSPSQDIKAFYIERENYPKESSLIDVFRQQSRVCPGVIAVKDADTELTYAELDRQSDHLSQWLMARRLPPETLVGVLAIRSCQTVVVFLGILKANLAYYPLDTSAPFAWVAKIISSVPGHRLVLVGDNVQVPCEDVQDCQFVPIAEALQEESHGNSQTISRDIHGPLARSLAYVMFTTGSGGQPKGVMIEHRGVIRLARQSAITSQLTKGTGIAHTADIAYNASTWEIYSAILNGGTLVCIDNATLSDSARLCDVFLRENIEIARFSPALLEQYLAESPSMFERLKVLISAGDSLPPQVARKALLYCPDGDVFNIYGSTENTGFSTCFLIAENDTLSDTVPIGQAVSNSGVVVMDSEQQLVPAGVLGELVITGDGLARGYLNPTTNKDRFIELPNKSNQPTLAYRTGDIVRRRPVDGELEFIGRMDRQVKILDRRLDLEEVEHALLCNDFVSDAVALVQNEGVVQTSLMAYVTLQLGDGLQELVLENDLTDDVGAVNAWTEMYDEAVYPKVGSITSHQLGRDFVGWVSMYDGQQLNEDDMAEWLDDTTKSILDGRPAGHVLEIGTGTGMILFNLGEGLQSYFGLEPVGSAVRFVAEMAASIPDLADKVKVQIGTATDVNSLSGLRPGTLVIVNSVAQHFPSSAYLQTVVMDLLHLSEAHQIFFGDIRSFALYDEFLVTMAMYRLGPRFSRSQLRQFMERIKERESELLIDPAFFTALKSQYPEYIEHVEILPKRVKARNELSCYRYAAVVHTRRQRDKPLPVHNIDNDEWVDFTNRGMNYLLLQDYLQQHADSPIIAVSNIPNRMIHFERAIVDSLSSFVEMFEECMLNPDANRNSSLSPNDLVAIAEKTGFRVELSCARQYSQRGSLDAVFHHLCINTKESRVLFNFPTDYDSESRPLNALVNQPQNSKSKQKMERKLQTSLQTTLPSYMVPSSIKVLDKIPITEDKKVDYQALAKLAEMIEVDRRA